MTYGKNDNEMIGTNPLIAASKHRIGAGMPSMRSNQVVMMYSKFDGVGEETLSEEGGKPGLGRHPDVTMMSNTSTVE